jgi:mannose-6-phosphate isomerase-like protein (cupin superfamily)
LQFLLEDDLYDAGPGDALYLPRGKVHQFRLMSDTPARVLVMAAPCGCGFETFIPEFAPRVKPGETAHQPSQDEIDKLLAACAKYGIELRPDHKPRHASKPANSTRRSLWVLGNRIDLKLNRENTNGAFSLATIVSPPGAGAPAHLHRPHDELFYVESGTFEFLLGDRTILAESGTTIFVPRGTMHMFKNVGTSPAQLVDYHFPAGFEEFFIEAGTDCTDVNAPAPALDPSMDLVALLRKHGMEVPA